MFSLTQIPTKHFFFSLKKLPGALRIKFPAQCMELFFFFLFFCFVWLHYMAYWILVLRPGIKPCSGSLESIPMDRRGSPCTVFQDLIHPAFQKHLLHLQVSCLHIYDVFVLLSLLCAMVYFRYQFDQAKGCLKRW